MILLNLSNVSSSILESCKSGPAEKTCSQALDNVCLLK